MTGEMNRAFTVDGIPAGRVGAAKILNLKADANRCLLGRATYDSFCRLPGGTARRPSFDGDVDDVFVPDRDLEFRRTKALCIQSQPILPGKSASGGWRGDPLEVNFFA